MNFNQLKNEMNKYRSKYDIILDKNQYIILMLDGRSFSKLIKKRFCQPFDSDFIRIMDETAKYLCENIQDCKFSYVQSDEITLVLYLNNKEVNDGFFKLRLVKLLSIIPSMATGKFQQLLNNFLIKKELTKTNNINEVINFINSQKLIQFDCKCFNIPTYDEVIKWLIFRQIDCIRNSKLQTAQAYLPHNRLNNLDSNEQIELLLKEKGINWHELQNNMKFGRFIYLYETIFNYVKRNKWGIFDAFNIEENIQKFNELNVIPKI